MTSQYLKGTHNALEAQNWPPVSVIIVTKGHHQMAESAVDSVLETDYPADKRQLVVIEETDNPQPIKGRGVHYHTIPEKNLGVAFARNQGLTFAKHPLVVFTDDDCVVERQWLKEIVRPLLHSEDVAAAAGAVLVPECGPVGQCENILGFPGGGVKYLYRSQGEMMSMRTFSTCNCAVNRGIIENMEFYEGFQAAGEDELLSRRISKSYLIIYNPKAIVRHQPRDTFLGVYQWFVRRGQARVEMIQHAEKISRYLFEIIYVSPILRLLFVGILFLAFQVPLITAFLLLLIIYYVSVLYRFRWSRTYYPSLKTFFLIPVVKSIMDMGMDVGVIKTLMNTAK